MKIADFSVRNAPFTVVVFVMLLALGAGSLYQMPRGEDPPFNAPIYFVTVVYPGTSPEDMESLVTDVIEERLNTLDDIKRIKSTINDGVSFTQIDFRYGVDIDSKYNDVVREINALRSELPDNLALIQIRKAESSDVITYQFAFVSDSAGYENLIFTVFETANPSNLDRDTVSVTVSAVDVPPQALPGASFTAFGGETFPAINLLNYFTSPDGNPFHFSAEPAVPANPVARPAWSVNPASFELNMNITAEIDFFGQSPEGNNLLGAFVGEELRGVASPQVTGGKALYFLTVFANSNGETIHFRFWHEGSGSIKTATNTAVFNATTSGGSVESPFQTLFGGVTLTVNGTSMSATARQGFSGTEAIVITAMETGTSNQFSAQTTFNFDVKTITRPRFRSIAPQTVVDNTLFQPVSLAGSITNEGNHPVVFSVKTLSGDALEPTISAQNVLSVVPKTADSFGVTVFQIRVARTDFPEAADSIAVRFERKASNTEPQPFALVFPGVDQTLEDSRFTFRWEPATVSDGRTANYTLRIQPDGGGSIVIRGLTMPEYALDGTEGVVQNAGYTWWVTVSDGLNTVESTQRRRFGIGIQVANESGTGIPAKLALHQNYPNPFNPTTQLSYSLPQAGMVTLSVYNMLGQKVQTLVNQTVGAGNHTVSFDASNLSNGMYVYRLEASGQVLTRKMLLVK
jgi:hypothetical protein